MQEHTKSFFHRKVHIVTDIPQIALIPALLLLGVSAAYLLIALYYGSGFAFNTWINGVYCTGKTVEEVNSELLSQTEAPIITITDGRGEEWQLPSEEISLKRDYRKQLQAYLSRQDPWKWGVRLFQPEAVQLKAEVSYDEEALLSFWNGLPFVQAEGDPVLWIEWTQTGYQLQDKRSERIDTRKAYALLQETILQGAASLDLAKADVYEEEALTKEQQDILQQWEKINAFQSLALTYDMGEEKLVLDARTLGGFLIRKEDSSFSEEADGRLSVSVSQVDAFINELADTYDTYGREREFLSTRGDLITVPAGGTYGTQLDADAEKEYLLNALENRISEVHIPSYKKEPYHRGKDDIGDTYIEVDMTMQKMYFYQNGECLVETDIVTGNTGRKMGTPQGVNYVYAKQKNRILRGPGYASPVKFWMPVKGNIGIHDAGWRASFGGEIYKTSGSHGCINTPYEKMKRIYEEAEIGTPVIMFY